MDCRSNKSPYIKINALSQTHIRSNKMVGHPYPASKLLSDGIANLSLTGVRKIRQLMQSQIPLTCLQLGPFPMGETRGESKTGQIQTIFPLPPRCPLPNPSPSGEGMDCRSNKSLYIKINALSQTHIRSNQMVGHPYPTAHLLFRRHFQPTTAPISPHTPPTASKYRPAARFR